MNEKQEKLDALLKGNDSWRQHAYNAMGRIPCGCLATYGRIAELVEKTTGANPGARNIAWLRKRLYEILTHDTDFPLHRISKINDIHSLADSEKTKSVNDKKRRKEGSLTSPKWI